MNIAAIAANKAGSGLIRPFQVKKRTRWAMQLFSAGKKEVVFTKHTDELLAINFVMQRFFGRKKTHDF